LSLEVAFVATLIGRNDVLGEVTAAGAAELVGEGIETRKGQWILLSADSAAIP
jgi:hypothetical protein